MFVCVMDYTIHENHVLIKKTKQCLTKRYKTQLISDS